MTRCYSEFLREGKINTMIIDNSKYYDTNITCSTCGKEFNPAKERKTLEALNVPPLVANIFCGRVCKEKYDKFLSENRAVANSL